MGDLLVGGLDVVGEMDGEMVLGRHHGGHAAARVPTPRWMNATTSQGVSRPQEELDFCPFIALTITVASGATTGNLTARPQRPMRGERLVMGATSTTAGADWAGNTFISGAIFVGAVQVGAAQGQTPFTAFAATAFGVRLSWPAMGQGTDVVIPVLVNPMPAADAVFITATVFGRAMR